MSQPNLTKTEMLLVDVVLEMGTGWVVNFSDRTFADFFLNEFSIDIDDEQYKVNGASKAKRLRTFLQTTEPPLVGQVLVRLLQHRQRVRGEPAPAYLDDFRALAQRLGGVFDPTPAVHLTDGAVQGAPAYSGSAPVPPVSTDDALMQRLSKVRSASVTVAQKDSATRQQFVDLSRTLAEECKRASVRVCTAQFTLDDGPAEIVYGLLCASDDGLHVLYRTQTQDLQDAHDNVPQEDWSYDSLGPSKWSVEWLRLIAGNGKIDELLDKLSGRIAEILGADASEAQSRRRDTEGEAEPQDAQPRGTTNPDRAEGSDFPGTVVFVLLKGIKESSDGTTVPKALAALNATLRGVDPNAYVLSTIGGAIIVAPDGMAWSLDKTLDVLHRARTGFPLRVGVAHGHLDVVTDIDNERNLVGPPINTAARLATSSDNPGALVHVSYADHMRSTIAATHWLHMSKRREVIVHGKPQDDPFRCFAAPDTFNEEALGDVPDHSWRSAVLIAYDLPKFSGGDRSELRKRFTGLAQVFKKLRQDALKPAELSPGGDGGVVVLAGVTLAGAADIAKRLRELTDDESVGHDDAIAVRLRIGVHYGNVFEYVNARGLSRPTGIDLFIADDVAGDEIARARDSVVVTDYVADAIVGGSKQRLATGFERLPPLETGPAAGVQRFVQLTAASPSVQPAQPAPPLAEVAIPIGAPPDATDFEPVTISMISERKRNQGYPVKPSIWKVGATPTTKTRATKAQLHKALMDALVLTDGDYGRSTRWPAVLRPGASIEERRPDGVQVWRHTRIGAATLGDVSRHTRTDAAALGDVMRDTLGKRHEELFGVQTDGTLWFQRAYFWDADQIFLDLGLCAFDVLVFLRMIVAVGNAIRVPSYDLKLAVEVPRPNMTVTIQTHGLEAVQQMRTAKATTRGTHLSDVTVGPQTSLPDRVQAGISKQLIDGIANEFVLKSDGAHAGPPFLEIDEASILRVLATFKATPGKG